MIANSTKLCNECVHASYCALTHSQSMVFSCSDFDPLENEMPKPLMKIKERKPVLATI